METSDNSYAFAINSSGLVPSGVRFCATRTSKYELFRRRNSAEMCSITIHEEANSLIM